MTDTAEIDPTQSGGHKIATIACRDLIAEVERHTGQLGYRLEMIMPADAPRVALVSRDGAMLRLQASTVSGSSLHPPDQVDACAISRVSDHPTCSEGRAGMKYRDLIPGRLGGRAIASHIRIPDAGPVPDYVHYHRVVFQMIYCRRGWARVVYEDQGLPFVLREGDCVLQPPLIRHRVLEASAGLEVVEVGCPAEHATWRDHNMQLPTAELRPGRVFAGQTFVRHVASDASWQPVGAVAIRDTGIGAATRGVADVRTLRIGPCGDSELDLQDLVAYAGRDVFLHVLEGQLRVRGPHTGDFTLMVDDACTLQANTAAQVSASSTCEVLVVALPPAGDLLSAMDAKDAN